MRCVDYFKLLEPERFLLGPSKDWTYYRGFWAPPYESIHVVDRDRSPFALFNAANLTDGIIEGNISVTASTEFAGFFFLADATNDLARGFELVFDMRKQRALLRKHESDVTTVLETNVELPINQPIPLRINVQGNRIEIRVGGNAMPIIDLDLTKNALGNQFGVRAWGGSVALDRFIIQPRGGSPVRIVSEENLDDLALQSYALLVLNLNEVVYVD